MLAGCGESSTQDAPNKNSAGAGGASSGSAGASDSSGNAGSAGHTGSGSESAAGSGSESGLPAYFEPGSRLKPKVLASEGGVDVIEGSASMGWYDSELDMDCFFVRDPAGFERCFTLQLVTGGLMFADADCSRPVVAEGALGACAGLRYQYLLADRGFCAYHGYRIGDELPPSTPLFFSQDGTCQPSGSTSELAPIRELEEVPAETFVGMRRSARERAPGLDAYVREGDDGSWQIIGHFDQARQASCFGPNPALNRAECLPLFASGIRWTDSTCETIGADASQRSCEIEAVSAVLHAKLNQESCPAGYTLELYDIDSIQETTPHEVNASGACVQSAELPRDFYIQGAPLDLQTLPTLERHVVGTGAVRAIFSGFGGVPYMPNWYTGPSLVNARGDACQPFDFPDGSARCVPIDFATATRAGFAYEDAACSSEPLVPWFPRSSCQPDAPLPRAVVFPDQTSQCPQRLTATEVVAVAGKSDSSEFYSKHPINGACQAIAATSPAPTYLRLGEAIEAAELPLLQRTIRD
jgi:hypothetical protein